MRSELLGTGMKVRQNSQNLSGRVWILYRNPHPHPIFLQGETLTLGSGNYFLQILPNCRVLIWETFKTYKNAGSTGKDTIQRTAP